MDGILLTIILLVLVSMSVLCCQASASGVILGENGPAYFQCYEFTGSLIPSHSLEYHFVNIPKNWKDAQSYCRIKYSDLATIQSNTNVHNMIKLNLRPMSWIGLHDDPNNWKLSSHSQSNSWKRTRGYTNWTSAQPSNENGIELCVVMNMDGSWDDLDCSLPQQFVCLEGGVYSKSHDMKSWAAASKSCLKENDPPYSIIAPIYSTLENIIVRNLLGNTERAWIGVHRKAWMWSDDASVYYKRWEIGQPDNAGMNEMCAASTSAGYWRDEDCALKYPFICSGGRKKRQTTLKVKITTNADMAVAHNKAQILQKLHQTLLASGVTDFNLRWVKEPQRLERRRQGLTSCPTQALT